MLCVLFPKLKKQQGQKANQEAFETKSCQYLDYRCLDHVCSTDLLGGTLVLLLGELLLVEVELLALEQVAVSPSGLAWAGGDGSENAARHQLLLNSRVQAAVLLASSQGPLPGVE